jgi:hypothetical protein
MNRAGKTAFARNTRVTRNCCVTAENDLISPSCAFLFLFLVGTRTVCTRQRNSYIAVFMVRILSLLLFVGLSFANAQQRLPNTPILSTHAEISVVTIGPWQGELYSAFGHSAFRVYDPILLMDDFYNYGVFDFDQPNFYLNFARGHLNYKLGVDQYPLYRDYFIRHNRYIHEQILNLDSAQKQAVFDYLFWNSQPENAYYFYDYFYDNCASRLRDILKSNFQDDLRFDSTFITTNYTIRQLTDLYLQHQPWGDLGIDICLGLPMDKHARPYEYMFLPDYIESSFDHAVLADGDSVKPLVKRKVSVYESIPEGPPKSLIHPWLAFGLFLALTAWITWRDWRAKKISKWFDTVVFGGMGLLGVLLFTLWVATDHRAAARNMNLLWAMPLHVFVLPAFWKDRRWAFTYFKVNAIILLLTLVLWAWLPQQLNVFLIPVVVALMIRAAWIGWGERRISTL